jgi:Type IV secretion system pilin
LTILGQNSVGTNYHSLFDFQRGFVVSLWVMKKILFGLVLCSSLFLMPRATHAAGLVPCGGAPPEQPCQSCDVVQLENNVVGWLVVILGVLAAIVIVYAGVKLVTSGGNQHAMEEAKSMINNIIIGYLIVLSAWLVIDYGLKALLDTGTFGVWNEVKCEQQQVAISSDPMMLKWSEPAFSLFGVEGWTTTGVSGAPATAVCETIAAGPMGTPIVSCVGKKADCQSAGGVPTVSADGKTVTCNRAQNMTGGVTVGPLPQCSASNGACSVSALMAVGLNSIQANVMSCIAVTESSGNPSIGPYNLRHPGSNSSACGTFQIVGSTWRATAVGSCSDFSNCTNAHCNAQTMAALVHQNGYRAWTCPGCNNRASACVNKYGG